MVILIFFGHLTQRLTNGFDLYIFEIQFSNKMIFLLFQVMQWKVDNLLPEINNQFKNNDVFQLVSRNFIRIKW